MSKQEVAISEPQSGIISLGVDGMVGRIQIIQRAMKEVMKDGVHYGVIPGMRDAKPSLLKAGAELLLTLFQIEVDPIVEATRSNDGHRHYRVKCIGRHQITQTKIGTGVGECSTEEEKYCWRYATGMMEFNNTPEERRRFKFYKKSGAEKHAMQVRTNPADQGNTCLKMAKKRAMVDLCLTALGASDIFSQDQFEAEDDKEPPAAAVKELKPNHRAESQNLDGMYVQENHLRTIKGILDRSGRKEEELCIFLNVRELKAIPLAEVNKAIDWAQGK